MQYFENDKSIYDYTGSKIATLTNYLNGENFVGFTSSNVYVSFDFHNVIKDNFEITVAKINNQVTNDVRNDYQEPKIIVNGELLSRVANGSTVTIPSATCYDVLNNVGELTVCIKDQNGNILMNPSPTNQEYHYKFDTCGTYIIEYYVEDYNQNYKKLTYVLTVFDAQSPELKFNGQIPTTVEVGSTMELPGYSIIDNDPSSCVVNCYVYYPNGMMKQVKNNKVQITEKGTHILTYIVKDINNNIGFYKFQFVAK